MEAKMQSENTKIRIQGREVALTSDELGRLLISIDQSSLVRAHKLALRLLMLCLVRRSALIEAKWEEINFEQAEWSIPGERMKNKKPHLVLLSKQALAIFEELKGLSSSSEWIFARENSLHQPISNITLNTEVNTLKHDVKDYVIKDFRLTGSFYLREAGFNLEAIKHALGHETESLRESLILTQNARKKITDPSFSTIDFILSQYDKKPKHDTPNPTVACRLERFDTPEREMMQWWADFISGLTSSHA